MLSGFSGKGKDYQTRSYYKYELHPVEKGKRGEVLHFAADLYRDTCWIHDATGEIRDQFPIRDILFRVTIPEFAGATRWPLFYIGRHSIECKVSRSCLRFIRHLRVLALCRDQPEYLDRTIRRKVLQLLLGAGIILALTPLLTWLFVILDEDEPFKSRSFGLMIGSFCAGVMLIIDSARDLNELKRARRLQIHNQSGTF